MLELILAVALATAVSFLCSITEAAFYSFPMSRIEQLRKAGKKSGDILADLRRDVEKPITAILTLNTAAATAGAAVAGAAAVKVFGDDSLVLFTAAFTLLILVLGEIIQRGMVKSGRLARLRMDVRDVPGALADVATLLGKLGANIDEVQHQRAFSSLSVERAEIEVVVHTRGVAHIEEILAAMRAQGYRAERIG